MDPRTSSGYSLQRVRFKYILLIAVVTLLAKNFFYHFYPLSVTEQERLSDCDHTLEYTLLQQYHELELQSLKDKFDIEKSKLVSKTCTADYCRTNIFRGNDQGGLGTISPDSVKKVCNHHASFQVCDDLISFTGLSTQEFDQRMERHSNFHFEGEHLFWNPKSATELTWYYTTSVDYLFANSLHVAFGPWFKGLTKEHEPILDYSGGVGNNVLKLAGMGIKTQYFGIGQMEKSFAEYRFEKRGYLQSGLVEIKTPWSEASRWKFDPIVGVLPRNGSLGAILAIDVLEHIPNYQNVAIAIVDSLRMGGILIENTPFARARIGDKDQDLRVHVSDGGIPMEKALGSRMKSLGNGRWEKVSADAIALQ